MDYNNLKPGWYLQMGDSLKTLTSIPGWANDMISGEGTVGLAPDNMAARVAWVFTALNARKRMLGEIEHEWRIGERELDGVPPFPNFITRKAIQRTDKAMMLYSVAYWHKLKNGRGGIITLEWIDPRTIEKEVRDEMGNIVAYKRRVEGWPATELPAADVIRIAEEGIGETTVEVSTMNAIKIAAEVLYYLEGTQRSVYANNALPVMLVNVPQGADTLERDRLRDFFKRLFNPFKPSAKPEYRVIPAREGVTVEKLSFAPDELATDSTHDRERDSILSAMSVPLSEVLGNAANFATAEMDHRRFVKHMGAVWQDVADGINMDADIMRMKMTLEPYPDRHPDLQKDEASVSSAFVSYRNGGFTKPAAAYLVGVTEDDFPAGMEIFEEEPEPQPVVVQPVPPEQDEEPDEPEPPNTRAILADLDKWAKYTSKHGGADGFKSHAIPEPLREWVLKHALEADVFERARQLAAQDAAAVLTGLQVLMAEKMQPVINVHYPAGAHE